VTRPRGGHGSQAQEDHKANEANKVAMHWKTQERLGCGKKGGRPDRDKSSRPKVVSLTEEFRCER
jgi:hypothetical protein